ncbi:type III-B CRISPR module-associated protein Cmr5 [Nocardiopsis coralliicola]
MPEPMKPVRSGERIDQILPRVALQILEGGVSRELRMRMRRLPAQLRGSGLAATYAEIAARSSGSSDAGDSERRGSEVQRAYDRLATTIPEHVYKQGLIAKAAPPEGQTWSAKQTFLYSLSHASTIDYTRVSAEVDALALWLSRLSTALFEESEERREDGDGEG